MGKYGIATVATIVLFLGVFVSAAADQAKGTITGTVTNSTQGGGSVAGLDITLIGYKSNTQSGEKTVKTDKDGKFSFDTLDTSTDSIYQASIDFQRATYYSQPVTFGGADNTQKSVTLTVFDSTTDDSVVKSPSRHYLVQPMPDGIVVSEIVVISNASGKAYVGSKEVHPGVKEVLRFGVPSGAQDLLFVDGLVEQRVVNVDGGFVDTLPVFPGDSQRVFEYTIPAQSGSASFSTKLNLPADKVNVLMPDLGSKLTVSNLPDKSNPEIQGDKYVLYAGQNLGAGTELQFKVTDLPKATAAAPGPASSLGILPFVAAGVVVVVVVAAVIMVVVVRRRRGRRLAEEEEEEEEEEEQELPPTMEEEMDPELEAIESEKDTLVAAIAALDDLFEEDKMSAEEYGRLRKEKKHRLVELAEQQKALQQRKPAVPAGGAK